MKLFVAICSNYRKRKPVFVTNTGFQGMAGAERFESAGFSIICCYYYRFQLILSCFQNYLYHLKPPRFCPFQSVKGKNKGNCLFPSSGNYASNLATTEHIMEFIGLYPLRVTTIEKSEHRSTMNGVRISCFYWGPVIAHKRLLHSLSFVRCRAPVSL